MRTKRGLRNTPTPKLGVVFELPLPSRPQSTFLRKLYANYKSSYKRRLTAMRLIFGATRNAVLSPPWATLWVLGHGGPPVTGPVERALFGALLAALGAPKQPEKAPTAMQTRRWRPAALRGYEKKPKRGASHPPFSK